MPRDYCFATEQASLALTEINLGIGPFVISPYVERKIGKSQLIAMSLDTQFRSPQWAMEHNILSFCISEYSRNGYRDRAVYDETIHTKRESFRIY